MIKILLVGTGNVATQLAKNLDVEKYQINQIFSRNKKNAEPLIEFLNCHWSNDPKKIMPSDMTIIAISDDNIKSVLPLLPKIPTMHTSGSIDMKILDEYFDNYGVFYPLQTFKKNTAINLNNTPFLIEGNNKDIEENIFELASSFSNKVYKINSSSRLKIHLSAVFACNFSNHMMVLGKKISEESNFDFSLLLPLIQKTFSQIDNNPLKLQTGPAVREDKKVMNKHLEIIEDENIKLIYKLISESIIKTKDENS